MLTGAASQVTPDDSVVCLHFVNDSSRSNLVSSSIQCHNGTNLEVRSITPKLFNSLSPWALCAHWATFRGPTPLHTSFDTAKSSNFAGLFRKECSKLTPATLIQFLWNASIGEGSSLPAVSPQNSSIVYGGTAGLVHALTPVGGAAVWPSPYNATTVNGSAVYDNVAGTWPAFSPSGDVVYVAVRRSVPTADSQPGCCCVHAINASSGGEVWHRCGTGSQIVLSQDGSLVVVYDEWETP